ncbi:MAG TPA: hypothetical protein VGL93_35060 [Streptosporangiaceae bacterium]|jgi:hypothetical protein
MSERADQIVLDYLRRVADAAYGVLRSDERLEFLARVRRRIDEVRIRQRADKPVQVQRVLDRFGSPEALVEQERLRLAAERPEDPPRPRRTTSRPEPKPDKPDPPSGATVVTGITPGRPPNETQPIPVLDASAYADGGGGLDYAYVADYSDEMDEPDTPDDTEEPAADAEDAGDAEPEEESAAQEPAPAAARSGPARTPSAYPRRAAPSDVWTITGKALPGAATAHRRSDFLDIAQRNKLAAVTVVLLGFGALALPVPLWLVGVVLLVVARAWPLGDKLLGAALPVVTVAVFGLATNQATAVLAMSAYTSAGAGGPRLAFGIGGLAGAAYLAVRLSRAPR